MKLVGEAFCVFLCGLQEVLSVREFACFGGVVCVRSLNEFG